MIGWWLALVVIAVAATFSLIWQVDAVVAVPRRSELRSALQPHL